MRFVNLLQGQTKEGAFLDKINQQLKDNAGIILSEQVSIENRKVPLRCYSILFTDTVKVQGSINYASITVHLILMEV